jgi:glycosyltransferase involved in cell wall biosynthesis
MSIQKARIIFVQDKFFLGGIEVLELKLVKELARRGYDVVVASRNHEAFRESSKEFNHFAHKGYPDFISRSLSLLSGDCKTVIFVSLHPTAAMASEIAGRKISRLQTGDLQIHHFHWVSHSRAFFFSQKLLIRELFKAFFAILPPRSTYFMSDAAKIAHQSFWNIPLKNYPIIRIIGREPRVKYMVRETIEIVGRERKRPDLRIVSVGRLVPFKSYNVNAPEIVRRLLESGINATWDIWGYGPDEPTIFGKARENDVADRVRVLGALPHAKFDETVSSYDVFVGMGTSVLEAAKTGTPSCVAVENQDDMCYGFLHEAPTDSVGDRVDGFPERRLHEVLHSFALLDSEARAKIGDADALAAQQKESTLDNFLAAILSSAPVRRIGLRERAILNVGKVYLQVNYWKHQGTDS